MRLVALLVLLSLGLAAGHSLSVSLGVTVRLSDTVPAKPQTVPAKPQTVPAKPQTVPAKTQTVPAKPQTVPAKPQKLPAKTQTVPAKPQKLPAKTQTVPPKTQTVPPKTHTAPTKTETMPAKTDAVSPNTVNSSQNTMDRIKETTKGDGNATDVGDSQLSGAEELMPRAMHFAMDLLSNSSKSLYGEQIETFPNEGDKRIAKWNFGTLFNLKFRSSRTNCLKGNETCTLLKPLSKPEDTPSILGLETQGPLYMPFIAPLNGTLSPGKTIKIEGRAMKFPETVYVYVRSNTGPALSYVPLVIRITYTEDKTSVEFYCIADGKQSEKDNKSKDKLFGLGQPFSIEIALQENKYNITINNKSFTYPARIPYKEATHVELNALAFLDNVEGTTKVFQRGLVEAPATPLVLPIHDLPLTGGKGRVIGMGGYILPAAENVEVRLQNSDILDRYSAAVISLTLDFKKRGLRLRHFIDGVWAEGKWHPQTQWFRPGREKGQPFYMEFHLQERNILCVFHGDWSIKYPYHVPLESANHLVITGDLRLDRITGLDTTRDCAADILHLSSKMWAGFINCTDNYYLSYARYGNVPFNS